ncbi:MAG TPA: hypothetical protein VK982_12975, partial [Bacteroidales bacterium]|nr:hypothetical protein [Bacteroidales bacterium]
SDIIEIPSADTGVFYIENSSINVLQLDTININNLPYNSGTLHVSLFYVQKSYIYNEFWGGLTVNSNPANPQTIAIFLYCHLYNFTSDGVNVVPTGGVHVLITGSLIKSLNVRNCEVKLSGRASLVHNSTTNTNYNIARGTITANGIVFN